MNQHAAHINEELRQKSLDLVYEEIAKPEKPSDLEIKIYKAVGVPKFRELLMSTIGRFGKTPSNYHVGFPSQSGLKKYVLETIKNESRHAPAAIGALLLGTGAMIFGEPEFGVAMYGLSALNGYPVMLQRYNRHRIMNIIERKKRIID